MQVFVLDKPRYPDDDSIRVTVLGDGDEDGLAELGQRIHRSFGDYLSFIETTWFELILHVKRQADVKSLIAKLQQFVHNFVYNYERLHASATP